MTPRDRIDREIVRLHAEGCPRSWIAGELGLSNTAIYERCRRLQLDFRAHSHRAAVLCPKGHNAVVVGVRDGRCARCGEPVELGRLIELDGRAVSRAAAREVARESRRAARLAKHMENWRQRRGA